VAPENLTIEEAVSLLQARAEKAPMKKSRRGGNSSGGAKKKKATKKSAKGSKSTETASA
jgi:topoisomerase IA-like protein